MTPEEEAKLIAYRQANCKYHPGSFIRMNGPAQCPHCGMLESNYVPPRVWANGAAVGYP
jgi:hypothetical protein